VPHCTTCGFEAEAGFKFCPQCGAAFAQVSAAREQRKTVTVLFCDVTGSTALGESTDPEALRALLARYFGRMKAILESHGASVEKFIGDAVMAVFGVPQAHEDDALRACRAAIEMQAALPELGVQARIGLNTGEVVTGTEERLATGDAVNLAARLEQAAQPQEILIGAETLTLVRDAVETEAVESLELKGKSRPVPAYRLLAVAGEPERRHESRFVGRERELELLREAWEGARSERTCRMVTLVGDAGVGKSRLAAELLSSLEIPTVSGRCLSYGEGITYWPVVGVTKQLGALPSDPAAAASLRSLLGETEQATSAEEIAWAFRKLLEEQAPLACVFDDIQWGEETFLDLVEHVALLSRGAPILLLCLSRPELLERRPQWTVDLRLESLSAEDVEALMPQTLGEDLREQIGRSAGGNPLFVTEMVAMTREAGGEVAVPPTLKALLAARLDHLEQAERSVLERGSVEGELFHRGAVQALAPNGLVTPKLAALVRKELIRPDAPQLPAEDAFRFRHLLIRDAAYEALPKSTRADLHERFAAWLESRGAGLAELEEILGHHLEQAARYKRELGDPDDDLAGRAGERLASAGHRAFARGDGHAARRLFERALELLRPLRLDVGLELDLAGAYQFSYEPVLGLECAERAAERAEAAGDRAGELTARVVAAHFQMHVADDPDADLIEALAQDALPLLEEARDDAALMYVWLALAELGNLRGQMAERAGALEHVLSHARRLGRVPPHLFGLERTIAVGPRPADEALRTLDELRAQPPTPNSDLIRALVLAMLNRFDEAWPLAHAACDRLREQAGDDRGEVILIEIALLAGDYEMAARILRRWCEHFEQRGYRSYLSTYAPLLGNSLCELGRYEEAEPLARLGRELGDERDIATECLWRQVQARVHAWRGEHDESEKLAREAVAIVERTDMPIAQGDVLTDLAEVLAAAGRTEEAIATLEEALSRYERKKCLAMVVQVEPKLHALRESIRA
jgi:class 3 adenylate cyclase/tetratricopeptide (TPR) repeat protein